MKISIMKNSSNWTLKKRNKNNHKVIHSNNKIKIKYNRLKKKKNNKAKLIIYKIVLLMRRKE
jgi:hypothetical protein